MTDTEPCTDCGKPCSSKSGLCVNCRMGTCKACGKQFRRSCKDDFPQCVACRKKYHGRVVSDD